MNEDGKYPGPAYRSSSQTPTPTQSGLSDEDPDFVKVRVQAEICNGKHLVRVSKSEIGSAGRVSSAGLYAGLPEPQACLQGVGMLLAQQFLAQAARRGLMAVRLEIEVKGQARLLPGFPGLYAPVPANITYCVFVATPPETGPEELREWHRAVRLECPVLNLSSHPQPIQGRIISWPEFSSEPSTIL